MATSQRASSSKVYFGQTKCQGRMKSGQHEGKPCIKKAYFSQQGRFLCGTHSSAATRRRLPRDPSAQTDRQAALEAHAQSVQRAAEENRAAGARGRVRCANMGMMRSPATVAGYLKVFPNYRHQNRRDGRGCAALSPMNLGPVHHTQRDVPPARCIENYHQFNKVFPAETDTHGQPTAAFRRARRAGYQSRTPQRHKVPAGAAPQDRRPRYSVHSDARGTERHYTYVQSRYFYCHFYEQLATDTPEFTQLTELLHEGTNLQICGFDAYDVTRDIMTCYTDPGRPFGHELVLYSMLTVADPAEYPWNRYYRDHREIYPAELDPSTCAASTPPRVADEKTQTAKMLESACKDIENSSDDSASDSHKEADTGRLACKRKRSELADRTG